jgi:hypothetical protein
MHGSDMEIVTIILAIAAVMWRQEDSYAIQETSWP